MKELYSVWKSVDTNVKRKFLEFVWDSDEEDIDVCEITSLDSWPNITYAEDGESPCTEKLDMENWEIIKLGDDEVIIHAGGDWQPPHAVRITLLNGHLVASLIGEVVDWTYGMSRIQLITEYTNIVSDHHE